MGKYKFRGLSISTGRWVYGNLVRQNNGIAYILPVDKGWFKVDQVHPETVGQWTGLHDRNGREIYEGDLVNMSYSNLSISECDPTAVEWITGGDSDGYFHGQWEGWGTEEGSSLLDIHSECSVLGTIHDKEVRRGE